MAEDAKKKLVVTGAAGYLGLPLVSQLARRGHTVWAVDADLHGTLGQLVSFDKVTATRMDFRRLEEKHLQDFDAIIHLASIPNDPSGDLFDEDVCLDINGTAVGRLASAALNAGVHRFIFMSSCSVYGTTRDPDGWCDEDSSIDPLTAYARGKRVAEKKLSQLRAPNFEIVILRGTTFYGYSPARMRFDLPVNRWCLQAYNTGLVCAVAPNLWRPLTAVVDAAQTIVKAVEAPPATFDHHVYNLGATQFNWKLGEVANSVAALFKAEVREIPLGRDSRSYRVNCDRLAKVLPEAIPIRGLDETIGALRYILQAGGFCIRDGYRPRCNAQNGYRALLATGEIDKQGYPARVPFGMPKNFMDQ